MNATPTRGMITYDAQYGHVCTCTEATDYGEDGYPSHTNYLPTVAVDRDTEPTESGSYFYVCFRCRQGAWSGC